MGAAAIVPDSPGRADLEIDRADADDPGEDGPAARTAAERGVNAIVCGMCAASAIRLSPRRMPGDDGFVQP